MAAGSAFTVVGRRLLQAAPVVVLATFIVFGLLKMLPGDVAVTLAGDSATCAPASPFSILRPWSPWR